MNNKIKILSIILVLSSMAYSKDNSIDDIEKFNSNLIVQGNEIKERIDYTLYPQNITLIPENATEETIEKIKKENQKELFSKQEFNYENNTIENGLHNGKTDAKLAIYAENGATIHNIGLISSYDQKINTNFGGVLITGIDNPLKRNDNLIGLKGNKNYYVNFINDGKVDMGATEHVLATPVNIAGLIPTSITFADYKKYIINAGYSNIKNNGTITNGVDHTRYIKALDVGILNGGRLDVDRRAVNLQIGTLNNTGLINLERSKQFRLTNGVAVDLLQVGLHFYRNDCGVNILNDPNVAKVKASENTGKIFVGGDIYSQGYSGIGVSALGADFTGEHNKYGVNTINSTFINKGIIEVERDLAKALDDNNNIVDLYLFYKNVLKLGLLSFTKLTETSIGTVVSGGEFYNNGGTISVGVNESKLATQLRKGAAIAVAGENGAKIYFNTVVGGAENETIPNEVDKDGKEIEVKSTINLEGIHVYATLLENGTTAIFNGTTEINFNMPPISLPDNATEEQKQEYEKAVKEYEEKRNKDIFYADSSSEIKVNGKIIANGDFNIKNLTIGGSYIFKKIDGKRVLIVIPGKIVSTGTIGLNGDVKLDSANFIGMSEKDLESYLNHKYIEAEKGLEGEGNLVSNSYLFDIKTDKTNNSISLTDVDRKDFNDIVLNKELGNIFETSYDGANEAQLAVYKLLAQGENQESFNKVVDEVTGKDTLTTLPAQIYDITRDLNGQFKDFAKNNRTDGVVFKYINSKSELDANSSTVGFDRKSSGIMVGYNNNLSEKLRLGAGFSYMTSDIDYTSNSKNKVTTWNARGYSDYDLGFANMFNDLSFAYNQSENKRMADQLSYTGMKESDTDVYTLSLNNSLYKEYKFGDKLTLVPSLNLDFTYIWQDAIKEDGAIGASAKKVEAFYGTLGAGVDGKYNLLTLENSKLNLVGGIDYAYDIIRETDDMSLQVSAFDPYYKENLRELDKKYLDLNVGLNYEYKDSYSVGVKYTKELINDVDNDQFAVDFTYKF